MNREKLERLWLQAVRKDAWYETDIMVAILIELVISDDIPGYNFNLELDRGCDENGNERSPSVDFDEVMRFIEDIEEFQIDGFSMTFDINEQHVKYTWNEMVQALDGVHIDDEPRFDFIQSITVKPGYVYIPADICVSSDSPQMLRLLKKPEADIIDEDKIKNLNQKMRVYFGS